LVCDEKHRQRLKTSRNKIINCYDVKLKILQFFIGNSIKTEKKLGGLSRLWIIGEGVVLLNKLLD
jgi:polynucleotide 5'-kinase involved in rRNA processing